jgi:hypothetical protein
MVCSAVGIHEDETTLGLGGTADCTGVLEQPATAMALIIEPTAVHLMRFIGVSTWSAAWRAQCGTRHAVE